MSASGQIGLEVGVCARGLEAPFRVFVHSGNVVFNTYLCGPSLNSFSRLCTPAVGKFGSRPMA